MKSLRVVLGCCALFVAVAFSGLIILARKPAIAPAPAAPVDVDAIAAVPPLRCEAIIMESGAVGVVIKGAP